MKAVLYIVILEYSLYSKLSCCIRFIHPTSFCFREADSTIGALDFILSVIRAGYRIPFISTPPPHHSKNNSSALEEPGFVAEAISELLCENRVKENSTS